MDFPTSGLVPDTTMGVTLETLKSVVLSYGYDRGFNEEGGFEISYLKIFCVFSRSDIIQKLILQDLVGTM